MAGRANKGAEFACANSEVGKIHTESALSSTCCFFGQCQLFTHIVGFGMSSDSHIPPQTLREETVGNAEHTLFEWFICFVMVLKHCMLDINNWRDDTLFRWHEVQEFGELSVNHVHVDARGILRDGN